MLKTRQKYLSKIQTSLSESAISVLIGELPEEENQLFTSSNKLFEFIAAGLAVIMPDVPGLRETADEYCSFELYTPGDFEELATKIDLLLSDTDKMSQTKIKSEELAKNELFWNNDFRKVLSII